MTHPTAPERALLPCRCGGPVKRLILDGLDRTLYRVACEGVLCMASTPYFVTRDAADVAWNAALSRPQVVGDYGVVPREQLQRWHNTVLGNKVGWQYEDLLKTADEIQAMLAAAPSTARGDDDWSGMTTREITADEFAAASPTQPDAVAELVRLHTAVVDALRYVFKDVPDDDEMLRRMEALGAAESSFKAYAATLAAGGK